MIGRRIIRRSIAGPRAALMILAATWLPGTAFAIANGIPVSPGTYHSTFPWAVALNSGGDVCSGELISPTYVLTAAHCAGAYSALIGATDRTTVTPIAISNAIVHPSYDQANAQYDVALLHLATPVYNTTPVRLVADQTQANTYLTPNRLAVIAGWGYTAAGGPYSNVLNKANIHLALVPPNPSLQVMLTWIEYQDGTAGPCAGDSGGPLTIQVTGVGAVLMGIADATDGDLCASGGGVAAYTNVAKVLPFINTNVPDLGQILLPSAEPDQATTTQDLAVPVAVAANDLGFGSPLTVTIVTPPAHGTAGVSGSPGPAAGISVTYTPAAGYTGADSLVYSVTDGVSSDTATVTLTVLADTDHDGVPNSQDNCTLVYNPDQRDTNGDGYGNMCDADFDGNNTVNINDFNRLKARLNISPVVDVDTDLDGNGAVNINDFNRLKSYLNQPPGPSGLHP